MKIFHFLGAANLPDQPFRQPMSGVVTVALEIARLQAAQGHEVWVANVGSKYWQGRWENVNLLSMKWVPWAKIKYKQKLFDFSRHLPFLFHSFFSNYDIIHTHHHFYLRGIRGKKIIAHFHSDPFYNGNDFYENKELKPQDFARILADTNAQFAVSQFVANQFDIGFNHRGNVHVVHNGVDINRFVNLGEERKREYRCKFSIPENARILLYAGAITREKGVIHLANAFRNLVQKMDNVYLLVVGASNIWGNSTTGDIQYDYSMAVKKELANEISNGKALFVGKIPYQEMPLYYNMSDIVVVPSIWNEGFGMVALEALAAGRPVIATRTGGMADFLNDGNSMQVQPGNVEELEHAMFVLLSDPILYSELARQSRNDISKFRWEDSVEKIFEIYNQL